ncbi:MAG: dehydrogenase [Bacteroidales bacterium]|nr:dehydrogenase [Bacteroidales bacterium]
MIYRSKAPLRLGLAGGGTDVSPYCDLYGGAILNATLTLYAHASIRLLDNGKIIFNAVDRNCRSEYDLSEFITPEPYLDLHAGVYNRLIRQYKIKAFPHELTTSVDAPPGSGLGTSSTLVVAILGAYTELLKLPLGEYDIASLAYEIERKDLNMAGGKQDQYAATFGGVNFMEFTSNEKVIVNPLRIRQRNLDELSHNLLLYYTETSRLSSSIIENQTKNVNSGNEESIHAMHKLKEQAIMMKEALLRGDLDAIGQILDFGWKHKKNMANGISNPFIDDIYETALKAGASGGKISGAGGGGFMTFYCPGNNRYNVEIALQKFGGSVRNYEFTPHGLATWSV